jgi:hypothetical protein
MTKEILCVWEFFQNHLIEIKLHIMLQIIRNFKCQIQEFMQHMLEKTN